MLAIHDQHDPFTPQMHKRLKITSMGLGLVRLLLDAGRTEEARATLSALENDFQGVADTSDNPSQKHRKAKRLKGVSRSLSFMALTAKLELVQ